MAHLSDGFAVSKLAERHASLLELFACGHSDSDEFVHKDIFAYQKENITVSYVLQDIGGEVASQVNKSKDFLGLPYLCCGR